MQRTRMRPWLPPCHATVCRRSPTARAWPSTLRHPPADLSRQTSSFGRFLVSWTCTTCSLSPWWSRVQTSGASRPDCRRCCAAPRAAASAGGRASFHLGGICATTLSALGALNRQCFKVYEQAAADAETEHVKKVPERQLVVGCFLSTPWVCLLRWTSWIYLSVGRHVGLVFDWDCRVLSRGAQRNLGKKKKKPQVCIVEQM